MVEPGSLEAAGVFPFKGSSSARLHGRKPGRKRQQQEYNRSRQKRGGCRLSYRGDELSRSFHWIVMETREHTGDFKEWWSCSLGRFTDHSRPWVNRLSRGREPKADEHQRDEKRQNCRFELNKWIHGFSFLFPRQIDSAIRGSGRGEEPPRGNVLHLIQSPFSDAEFGKNRGCLSRQLSAAANRRFQVHKRSYKHYTGCSRNAFLESLRSLCGAFHLPPKSLRNDLKTRPGRSPALEGTLGGCCANGHCEPPCT